MTALSVQGLSKSYADRAVLRELSFIVEPGEVVSVRGPNGAGKSTLLGCVVGTVIPGAGTVHVGTISLADRPIEARAAFRYVPQEAEIPEGVTGHEVLGLLAAAHGAAADLDAAARLTGLGESLPLLASAYSVGMRRRLQLGAIVLGKPALLVLDEPFAGLDAAGRQGLLEVLGACAGAGAGILVAAHDLDHDALRPLGPRELMLSSE